MNEMDEIIREFLVESNEGLDQMDRDLVELERDPRSAALLASIFRAIHTIKGTGGVLGFTRLEAVAHQGESLLSRMRDGKLELNREITSALLAMADALRWYLVRIEADGQEGDRDFPEVKATLTSLLGGTAEAPKQAAPATAQAKKPEQAEPALIGELLIAKGVSAEAVASALEQQSDGDPRRVGEILIEQGVAPAATVLDALNAQGDTRLASAAGNIRVDVGLLDKVMDLVGELVLARNQILQFTSEQQDATFLSTAQRLNLITTELQEGVMKTRMQPIGNIWNKLPRVVRDLALSCNKQVRLEMEGSDTELDKTIIEAVKDPMTHIVRNALDHGLETPATRVAAGKPAEGRLLLRAFHEGGQVNIEIIDDGAGIDLERVKQKAMARGLVTAPQAARMSDRELVNLIFLPGFSTAEKVTNVSGRGVGMDVVKTNIEKIGGTVDVQSVAGQGTTLKIKIPLTLAIIPALIVTASAERFAIPQVSLLELVRLDGDQARTGIEHIHGAPVYRLRGNLLPLVYLQSELKLEEVHGVGRRADSATSSLDRLDFENARFQHLAWKDRLRAVIEDRLKLNADELASHTSCALGQWLYGYALNAYSGNREMAELEAVHREIHATIRDAVIAKQNGNLAQAERNATEVENMSAEILACLTAVEHQVGQDCAVNIVVLQADDRQFGLVVDEINDTEEIVVKPLSKQLKGITCFAGATIMGDGQVALILDVLGLAQQAAVVSQVQDRKVGEIAAKIANETDDRDSWLIFQVGGDTQMAVPLALVSRLEEFVASDVERAGQREVVQYRGSIMPLVRIGDAIGAGSADTSDGQLQVIVYGQGENSVGLVVDRIVDVVEEKVVIERRVGKPGLLGSAVIRQRVTDLLDVPQLVAANAMDFAQA